MLSVTGRLRAAAAGWAEDQAAQMGAALAYYTLFSLAPLLILAMAVLGAVFDRHDLLRSRLYADERGAPRLEEWPVAEVRPVIVDGQVSPGGGR